MQIQHNGAVAAVAACLRGGGEAFGLDAGQWADIILVGGEPQDLNNVLAALLEPENIQAGKERQRLVDEIMNIAEATV